MNFRNITNLIVFAACVAGVVVWYAVSQLDSARREDHDLSAVKQQSLKKSELGAKITSKPNLDGSGSQSAQSEDSAGLAATLVPSVAPTVIPVQPVSGIVPSAVVDQKETTASASMYLAHSSLRIQQTADPESTENTQILQTMVTKALARTHQKKTP